MALLRLPPGRNGRITTHGHARVRRQYAFFTPLRYRLGRKQTRKLTSYLKVKAIGPQGLHRSRGSTDAKYASKNTSLSRIPARLCHHDTVHSITTPCMPSTSCINRSSFVIAVCEPHNKFAPCSLSHISISLLKTTRCGMVVFAASAETGQLLTNRKNLNHGKHE